MSISLNNHESRLKRLEDMSSSGYKETILYNTPIKIDRMTTRSLEMHQPVKNYNFLIIESCHSDQTRNSNSVAFIPTRSFDSFGGGVIDIYQGGDGVSELGRHIDVSFTADKPNTITFSPYDTTLTLYTIIGLNLYYKLRAFVSEVISCLSR